MSVNKYKILLPENNKYLDIPLEMNWDFLGRDDSIQTYQNVILKDIIGNANDFEILQFTHKEYIDSSGYKKSAVNYEFYFYDNLNPVTSPVVTPANWINSYLDEGFTTQEVYYYSNSFTKSFFKLDFYDTPQDQTQKNYFTIILPVQQGFTQSVSISPVFPLVDIKKPKFQLDFIGDKEGFNIYWLRKKDYVDISTFYMSAKFFNAKTGEYVKMTNTPQPSIGNLFTFNPEDYFYYKVNLDYPKFNYEVLTTSTPNIVIGLDGGLPIRWYEYINP